MVNDFIFAAATSFVMRSVISSLDCSCFSGVLHSVNWTLEAYGFMGSMCWMRVWRVSSRSWQRCDLSTGCGTVAPSYLEIQGGESHHKPETGEEDEKGGEMHKWFPGRQIVYIVPDEREDRFGPRCGSDVVDLIVWFRHRNTSFGGLARLGAHQTLEIDARQYTRYQEKQWKQDVERDT